MRLASIIAATVFGAFPPLCASQIRLGTDDAGLTLEAFVNATGALVDAGAAQASTAGGNVAMGFRALARSHLAQGADIGARLSIASLDSELRLLEASVLLFGGGGRLEIGERMGLPDVLTGYAPNNFTFTGAEFGPASGPSLDPGGGLQIAFLDRASATQLAPLTALGFAASQSDDVSPKVLYVTPKRRGVLGGVSYAPRADDPRFAGLVQAGLTHERYWAQHVLRWGGSYAFARGGRSDAGERFDDLHSLNLGVSATLDDSLMLGVSATFNGDSGQGPRGTTPYAVSPAWGVVASINYNTGPWTYGAYWQYARAEGAIELPGDDRLAAFEAGLSYRFNTRMRVYGAWYHYELTDEGGVGRADGAGDILMVGARVTL